MRLFSIQAVLKSKTLGDFIPRGWHEGIGGWLLVTSDEYSEAKWNAPSETIPRSNEAPAVAAGNIF
jgi:hypothetical protein